METEYYDVQTQISKFINFFETRYMDEILERVRRGKTFLAADFMEIAKFDHKLAEQFLEEPEELFKTAKAALENFDESHKLHLRLFNLSKSQYLELRNIRSKHINQLFCFEGVIRQKSEIRPWAESSIFECPSCGNRIATLHFNNEIKYPTKCACGRKGKFRKVSSKLVDVQRMVLEEALESLEGTQQPTRMNIFLRGDLVSPLLASTCQPGMKVKINGIVNEASKFTKKGTESQEKDIVIEANYIEILDETYDKLEISPEEQKEILTLSKHPELFDKLIKSYAPSIEGHEDVKLAVILQSVGGLSKTEHGKNLSGNIHILLIGDPGAGKTVFLKFGTQINPKCKYSAGRGSSGCGLTFAVVKDDFIGGWALEAGALVLANKGICVTGDTEILTKNNIQKIKNVKKGELVYSMEDGKLKPVKVINTNKRMTNELYSIKFQSGDSLNITGEHPLPLWDNGIKWTKVKDLILGDYIMSPYDTPSYGIPYTFDFIEECFFDNGLINKSITDKKLVKREVYKEMKIPLHKYYKDNKLKAKDIKSIAKHLNISPKLFKPKSIPTYITDDMMELAGLIASEGHISKKKNSIRFTNRNDFLLDRFHILVKRVCNKVTSMSRGRDRYFASAWFHEFLINIGIPKGDKSKKEVFGDQILSFSNSLIKSYLIGFINGDGNISNKETSSCLTITSGNLKSAEVLRKLFRKIGMIGTVHTRITKGGGVVPLGNYTNYPLNITGICNLKKIDDSRLVDYKRNSLKAAISRKDLSNRIPHLGKLFSKIRNNLPHTRKNILYNNQVRVSTLDNCCLSKRVFGKVMNKLKGINEINQLKEFKQLKQVNEGNIYFNKISSIKKIKKKEEVYNIEVGLDKNPNYIANFIVTHNCLLDEFDKMTDEDREAIHEGMTECQFTVNKASIHTTLQCDTTILAGANPKYGRFDPQADDIASQIDLPPSLMNRFDLIFPFKDEVNEGKDRKIMRKMLKIRSGEGSQTEPAIDLGLLKKYISYARSNIKPTISEDMMDLLEEIYIQIRHRKGKENNDNVKSVPINARQGETLIRLSQASARIRLSNKVEKQDVERSKQVLVGCLETLALDPETGLFDIDRISTDMTHSKRDKLKIVLNVIREVRASDGLADFTKVTSECLIKGIADESEVDETIASLRKKGEIFEPRAGFLAVVGDKIIKE